MHDIQNMNLIDSGSGDSSKINILLNSIPKLNEEVEYLDQIDGSVPHPLNLPVGCRFAPRCKFATQKCIDEKPNLVEVEPNHLIRCFYPNKEQRDGK